MIWNYQCPHCREWRQVDWEKRGKEHCCHRTGKPYLPPSPADQHGAWVDTHDWPLEIERVVVYIKGSSCTVPGCTRPAETLDHRIAYSRGGLTSIGNLFPMCHAHNQRKGDSDYEQWLLGRYTS